MKKLKNAMLLFALVGLFSACAKEEVDQLIDVRTSAVGSYAATQYDYIGSAAIEYFDFDLKIDPNSKDRMILISDYNIQIDFVNIKNWNDLDFTFDLKRQARVDDDGDAFDTFGANEYEWNNTLRHGGYNWMTKEIIFYTEIEYDDPQYAEFNTIFQIIAKKK